MSKLNEAIEERDAVVRKAMRIEEENAVMRGQCQAFKIALEIVARAGVKG